MSSTTKPFEEKMNASVNHLVHELASIRAGRANPAILDKVTVDYYGSPTPIQQIAAVAVAEARILTISPWDRSMLKPISKAIQTSDIGINPIDDGQVIRLVFPAPTEERRPEGGGLCHHRFLPRHGPWRDASVHPHRDHAPRRL